MKEEKPQPIPMWPFIAPFLAFMLIGFFEREIETPPVPENPAQDNADSKSNDAAGSETSEENQDDKMVDPAKPEKNVADLYDVSGQAQRYIWTYCIRIAIVIAILAAGWFIIYQQFPFRISFWCWIYGIVGFALWIGLCELGIEEKLLGAVGLGDWLPKRTQFNPFEHIDHKSTLVFFLIARFIGLVVVIPIIEELFLRGFIIRYTHDPQWWTVKLGSVGVHGIIVAAIYGAATHPEIIAAVAWFSLISLLIWQRGNLWDCIIAHAITNLLLGIYIITYSQWHLW